MNSPSNENRDDLIIVARAVRTRGLKGELVADVLTDFPERFEHVSELTGVGSSGERKQLEGERVQLSQDEFYDWELEGCSVENKLGSVIGKVREVMRTGGVELLVVENEARREILIPMAQSIVVEIDKSSKKISIDPPEGLLDL